MKKQELKRFTGGMNQDMDPDYIPEGDYIEAWNSTGHRGVNDFGRLFNLLGTEANAYTYGGANTETIIGTAFDRPNHCLYYFVHSTGAADFIVEINLLTKTNTLVATYDFGFSLSYPVQAIVESGVLIWTDNFNPPRRLEIERAKNTTAGAGTPQYPTGGWTDQTFDCVWYPPNERPAIAYGSDSSRETNNIQKKVFQFAYRYKYYDKGRSVFGPYSEILIPTGEEDANGQYIEDSTNNNKIVVQCYDGTELIDEVELFVRELRTDSAIGYWRLCKTFVRGVDTITANYYSFDFVNDRSQQIDINEALRPYDYIPRKAKTVTTIRDSQVVFGNYTQDYDNVVPNVALAHEHWKQANTVAGGIDFTPVDHDAVFTYPDDDQPPYVTIDIGEHVVQTGKVYYLLYNATAIEYTALVGDTTDDVALALVGLASNSNITIPPTGSPSIIKMSTFTVRGDNVSCSAGGLPPTGTVYKAKTWKKGAYIPLGIIYRDIQGRPVGGVAQNTGTRYRLPFSTEEREQGGGTFLDHLGAAITTPDYYTKLTFTVNHLPPDDAVTWQWVYLKNNLSFYETYKASDVKTIIESGSKPRIGFDINSDIFWLNNLEKKTRLSPYEFTEGDRLRIITDSSSDILTTYLDFAIHGTYTETDENETSKEYVLVDNFDFASYNIAYPVIEIYRPDYEVFPAEDKETPVDYDEQWRIHYFEIGPVYEVYDSGGTKYHRGDTQDQTSTLAALGTVDGGDCYQRTRLYPNKSFFAECNSISDYYNSAAFERGRIALYLSDMAETTYDNGLVYGGQNQSLHDDTNFMFSFDYTGFSHEILKEHGPIHKIIAMGDILKVFQETLVSSVYIGRDAAITSNGEQIIRTSDKVLGSIRPSQDNFGTIFPTSIVSDGTNIYFFDLYSKAFVVNTPSGNKKLSDYGMSKFFIQTCDTLIGRTLSDISVFTAIDRFGYIVLTIRDDTAGSTINWSLIFDGNKHWKSFWDNPPDYMAGWDKLVSFVSGSLYLHNEDADNPGLILGSQQAQSVELATTADPGKEKTWLTVILDTNHNMRWESKTYSLPGDQALLDLMWSAENKGDLQIPVTAADVNGKQTRLLPLRWFRMRNELMCTIPPDMYDPEAIARADVVASGSIVNGTVYHVDYDDVVYDGVTYNNGDEFTGTAITTYTGSGKVRTVSSIEAISITDGRSMKGPLMFLTIRNEATTSVWLKTLAFNYIIQ